MRLKRHAPLLESALKRAAVRPLFSSQCTRRRYSSSSAAHPERIAILGGGISGLSSAYFLAKEFQNTKITVYESSKQTGGWIRSNRVDVDGGTALFEYGPRTLRNSAPTLQIIQELGLVSEVLSTDNDAPGAKKKYIYYPDRLNALPTETPGPLEMLKLYSSGILDGALGVFMESFRPRRHLSVTDETIGSFLARRVDKRIANNIVSAVFHGIYAGDIWQLSAKTLLPLAWNLEARYGCALKGFVQLQGEDPTPQQLTIYNPYDLRAWRAVREEIHLDPTFVEQLRNASVMTFKGGLGRLVGKLQETLERNPNVSIKPGSPIQSFKMVEGEPLQVEVVAGNGPSQTRQNYDLVISTLRNKSLTPYVTVMTVNMFFPRENLLPVQGFGYLIPQSVPFEQNPERALGVIFDSDAISGQDTAKGTKVTVMLGGHWWDNWAGYPDEQEGLELAKSVLKRHLNINAEPTATHVNLSQDCIPQYTVGYEDRLKDFAKGLQDEYKGRLRVVGNQFNGVGVNDCIKAAWLLARDLRGDGWKSTSCGLDRALQDGTLTIAPMSEMQYIYEKP